MIIIDGCVLKQFSKKNVSDLTRKKKIKLQFAFKVRIYTEIRNPITSNYFDLGKWISNQKKYLTLPENCSSKFWNETITGCYTFCER